tara:strand:- start:281 stop:574 length:294 start_codon:yes stop_codon:yes gene_type:complete
MTEEEVVEGTITEGPAKLELVTACRDRKPVGLTVLLDGETRARQVNVVLDDNTAEIDPDENPGSWVLKGSMTIKGRKRQFEGYYSVSKQDGRVRMAV